MRSCLHMTYKNILRTNSPPQGPSRFWNGQVAFNTIQVVSHYRKSQTDKTQIVIPSQYNVHCSVVSRVLTMAWLDNPPIDLVRVAQGFITSCENHYFVTFGRGTTFPQHDRCRMTCKHLNQPSTLDDRDNLEHASYEWDQIQKTAAPHPSVTAPSTAVKATGSTSHQDSDPLVPCSFQCRDSA